PQISAQVEYVVFPRALALAEALWLAPDARRWEDFNKRLLHHYRLLQRWDVNYRRPSYTVDVDVEFNADTLTNTISFTTEQHAPGIRYTTNGKDPDAGRSEERRVGKERRSERAAERRQKNRQKATE